MKTIAIVENIVKTKTMKYRWLFAPTQLLIHGQWWSNLSTQRLHTEQCLLRDVRIVKQSAHNWVHSTTSRSWRKSILSLEMYPGSRPTDKARQTKHVKVETALTMIYQIAIYGKVMKISIRMTPKKSITKITRFFGFFLIRRVGGLSIRQSSVPGGLSIRLTSLANS